MSRESSGERERLAALRDTGLLDTPPEREYDDLTSLAARVCAAPMALITLVDDRRQWFKSRIGLAVPETPRQVAFCDHTIRTDALLEVRDAREDARFRDNPLVTGDPGIRFYAGAPLVDRDGHRLGTICVLDSEPRGLDADQRDALSRLARQVVSLMELRRSNRRAREEIAAREKAERALQESRDWFARLFHGSPVPTALSVAETGELLDANQEFLDLVGRPREEVLGRTSVDLGVWGDADSRREGIADVIGAGGALHSFERQIPRPGRAPVYVTASASLVELEGRQCLLTTLLDITERRRMEEQVRLFNRDLEQRLQERSAELLASERRYRMLVEASPDAIFVDRARRVDFVNAAMLRLFGAERREQLLGRSPLELVPREDVERVVALIASVEASGFTPPVPIRVVRLDGSLVDVEVAATAFEQDGEQLAQIVLRDLSERHRSRRESRELEERNQALVATLAEIVYDWQPARDRLTWGGDYTRILGYGAEEMGRDTVSWRDRIHPEDGERVTAELERAAREDRLFDLEYRFRCRDGSYKWMHDRGVLTLDAQGRVVRVLGVFRDLSAVRAAERARLESERLAHATLDALAAHVAILNGDGEILATNRSWRRFADRNGLDPSWSRPGASYLAACDRAAQGGDQGAEEAARGIRDVLAGRSDAFAMEYPCHGPGERRWFMCRVTRLGDGDARAVVAHENVTEVKLAEERLRHQQELNRLTLENLSDGVVACDAEGKLFLFNRTAREWHGGDPLEIPQERWAEHYDLFEGDGVTPLPPERVPLVRAYRGERVENAEMSIVRKGGAPRFVLANGEAILDGQGSKRGAVVVMHDVTELRSSDRLLRESLHEKETLLREIHHRVKNNLQVVSSLLDLQMESAGDPVVRRPLHDSINRVRSMSMIHEQLYQSATLSRVDLGEYAEKLAGALLRSHGGRRDVRLQVEAEPAEVSIETAVPYGLILNELISNAFKHAFAPEEAHRLLVQVARRDGRYRLVVHDDGPGLPAGFDLHRSASLGLQLVATLVRQLKGELSVGNDAGARFCLEFGEIVHARPRSGDAG